MQDYHPVHVPSPGYIAELLSYLFWKDRIEQICNWQLAKSKNKTTYLVRLSLVRESIYKTKLFNFYSLKDNNVLSTYSNHYLLPITYCHGTLIYLCICKLNSHCG